MRWRVTPLSVRLTERFGGWRYAPAVAISVLGFIVFGALGAFAPGAVESWWRSWLQVAGFALTYTIVSAYLVAGGISQYRRVGTALAKLAARFPSIDREVWQRRALQGDRRGLWLVSLVGGAFGLSQYDLLLTGFEGAVRPVLFVALALGNVLVWVIVARLSFFRLGCSIALFNLGRSLEDVDVLRVDELAPFAEVALFDLMILAGALALMPLQSLDANFEWGNYVPGFLVGVATGLPLFFLPLIGVGRRIAASKRRRLAALDATLADVPRDDYVHLEALLAHRERVAATHALPLDLRVVARALFYATIPPLAWVGAALVERGVERLID